MAATKASIMISLNGVLLSVLLLSGAYLMGSDRLLLIPLVLVPLTWTIPRALAPFELMGQIKF